MKKEKLYSEFEELGQRIGVKIIKGKGNFTGGICIVKDETVIVVNKLKPIEHRLKINFKSVLNQFKKPVPSLFKFLDFR